MTDPSASIEVECRVTPAGIDWHSDTDIQVRGTGQILEQRVPRLLLDVKPYPGGEEARLVLPMTQELADVLNAASVAHGGRASAFDPPVLRGKLVLWVES